MDKTDLEWVEQSILDVIQASIAAGRKGAWEEHIVDRVVAGGRDRVRWARRDVVRRALVAQYVLEILLQNKRIVVVETQATGRRQFQAVNILDTIAQRL